MTATKLTENLYIGDIQDVREGSTKIFDHVVTVCQDNVEANISCDYSYYNLADGDDQQGHNPGKFSQKIVSDAVDDVVTSIRNGDVVLVHCHAGQSRSASVCIASIAIIEGISWNDAYNRVKRKRNINPHGKVIKAAQNAVKNQL